MVTSHRRRQERAGTASRGLWQLRRCACLCVVVIGVFGVARAPAATGPSLTEFSLPASSFPSVIEPGLDGAVWFTEEGANEIGRMAPDGTLAQFVVPTPNAGLAGVAWGPDGNVWFAESNASRIGRLNPATGQITEFSTTPEARDLLRGRTATCGWSRRMQMTWR